MIERDDKWTHTYFTRSSSCMHSVSTAHWIGHWLGAEHWNRFTREFYVFTERTVASKDYPSCLKFTSLSSLWTRTCWHPTVSSNHVPSKCSKCPVPASHLACPPQALIHGSSTTNASFWIHPMPPLAKPFSAVPFFFQKVYILSNEASLHARPLPQTLLSPPHLGTLPLWHPASSSSYFFIICCCLEVTLHTY